MEGVDNHFHRQLSQSATALLHGNRAILFRHGRWHYLTLGRQGGEADIQTLNFMSPARAEPMITDWLARGVRPTPFARVSAIWAAEVAAKILPTAEAYRPLLLAGRVRLVRGHTTDTLWVVGGESDDVTSPDATAVLPYLAQMMATGQAGPYLRFG